MKNIYQRCFLNSGICLAAQISEQRKCLAASISRRRGGGGRLEIEAAKHFLCSDIWARYTSNYTVQKTALVWGFQYPISESSDGINFGASKDFFQFQNLNQKSFAGSNFGAPPKMLSKPTKNTKSEGGQRRLRPSPKIWCFWWALV